MAKTFYYLLKEARPRQWIKNAVVFTAVFFSGQLLNFPLLQTTIIAYISFCLVSSSIYYINDLTDIEKDRLHPFKRNRPIAAGKISKNLALATLIVLIAGGVLTASLISLPFLMVIAAYYALHLSYSFVLKNIMLLDILAIAAGFIIRVFGGEVATGYHINFWLFLTVISVSLFLAIGKRRSELTLMSGWEGGIPARTRATLSRYSERMLDVYLSMFANSAWLTYALYTFLAPPPILRKSFQVLLDDSNLYLFQERKWMVVTIPFVIFGIMRYLQLIYEKNEGESPEKVLLSDRPLIITAIITGSLVFGIIYIIGK
ncbi:MAG: UbiA prenyltransferase [Microgenomates group bacterium GW2011_GWA1_48_10]|uniref:Phosphoribose diphosphate--decaprenyl-phosphate phosphoribosyltransferase n=1 Tax=Candidatus Gottesmanbacteria bacterium RIFCSPHIGHO2_01_FULL_47_48 TaxID=1798381 RepID=A0A1F6A5L5_9BACT|nr:MAG: UbiA prenyltransferase [Microgenomates group bacterium GW2011_GWA1_48_10]OGG19774.1 MAG: hypothetical protein A2721_01215 [Candidatus Gottesmanbacteria bacterium RIFCSPHIGHO2_01_FULL_47_48]